MTQVLLTHGMRTTLIPSQTKRGALRRYRQLYGVNVHPECINGFYEHVTHQKPLIKKP
jgi:hypothetical protein